MKFKKTESGEGSTSVLTLVALDDHPENLAADRELRQSTLEAKAAQAARPVLVAKAVLAAQAARPSAP